MLPERLKETWISSLLSGEYKQGHGHMIMIIEDEGETEYCCLGVLCDVIIKTEPELAVEHDLHGGHNGMFNVMTSDFLRRVGDDFDFRKIVSDENWTDTVGQTLVEMNDSGKSFQEIAGFIKEHM